MPYFQDTRQEIPGSEAKDSLLLTAIATPRWQAFLLWAPGFIFHMKMLRESNQSQTESPTGTPTYPVGCTTEQEPEPFAQVSLNISGGLVPRHPASAKICRCLRPLHSALHISIPHLQIQRSGCTGGASTPPHCSGGRHHLRFQRLLARQPSVKRQPGTSASSTEACKIQKYAESIQGLLQARILDPFS